MNGAQNWKVLVSAPYAMPVIDLYRRELAAAGCQIVVPEVRERLEESDLLPLVGDIDGIICGDDRITARVLAAAPRLKVISKWGTGIDSIDQEAARSRGIAVRNTPNAFSEPVADSAIGYMLMHARQLDRSTEDLRAGRWSKPQLISLSECTIGVIGVGNCGRAFVKRAAAFGARLLVNDIRAIPDEIIDRFGLIVASLEQVLREADYITLHTDLNPTSHHLINADRLAVVKPAAYLVNTSRGPVVDESALIDALLDGRLAGAALDVFEQEPLPADSPLRGIPSVQLAPHTANSSPAAASRVHTNTIKNLLRELHS